MVIKGIKIEKVNPNQRNIPPVEAILCAPSIFNDTARKECNVQIANEKTRNITPLNKQYSNDFFCPFKKYNQYKEYKT
jgi:hypothetical protein